MAEMRTIYKRVLALFILVFYGLSAFAIFTEAGRQILENLSGNLPVVLSIQYGKLKRLDNMSHLSYLISFPTIILIGLHYSYRLNVATKALYCRSQPDRGKVTISFRESSMLAAILFLLLLVIVFSGSISEGGTKSESGGWLLWPISGLVTFSATALIVTGANSLYLLFLFKREAI
jgi:hypothetical protein